MDKKVGKLGSREGRKEDPTTKIRSPRDFYSTLIGRIEKPFQGKGVKKSIENIGIEVTEPVEKFVPTQLWLMEMRKHGTFDFNYNGRICWQERNTNIRVHLSSATIQLFSNLGLNDIYTDANGRKAYWDENEKGWIFLRDDLRQLIEDYVDEMISKLQKETVQMHQSSPDVN